MSPILPAPRRIDNLDCVSRITTAEFLDHLQCLRPPNAEPIHGCALEARKQMEWLAITDTVKGAQLVGALCCMAHEGESCLIKRGSETCKGKVDNPEESLEYFAEIQEQLTGEAMSTFCGEYSSVEQCEARIPHVIEELRRIRQGVRDGTLSPAKSKSMVLPTIAVLTRPDF